MPSLQLENNWLDWDNPQFLRTDEQDWNRFLEDQRKKRHRTIDADLSRIIRGLDALWIMRMNNGYTYSLEYEHRLAARPTS